MRAPIRAALLAALTQRLRDRTKEQRLEAIRGIVRDMDKWWVWGFITNEAEYLAQRLQLRDALKKSRPDPTDESASTAALLNAFAHYWSGLAGNEAAQQDLVRLLVDRVHVQDVEIVAVTFCPGHHVLPGQEKWANQLPD